jgi:hypothetical protein
MQPATPKQIKTFEANAIKYNVPQQVIDELKQLYKVANEFEYDIVIGFFSCDDEIIFEWWNDKELWLGQMDLYVIRWANNKFCLGDASNVSFSEEYEFETIADLLNGCVKEIESNER